MYGPSGASAELQQILTCNSEAAAAILATSLQQTVDPVSEGSTASAKKSLGPGDYVVLQTPVLPSQAAGSSSMTKKSAKKMKPVKIHDEFEEGRSKSRTALSEPAASEVRKNDFALIDFAKVMLLKACQQTHHLVLT